jgi:hypothetical protein
MTIDRLSELYQKGYYSKLDFYLGLIAILSEGGDPGPVMERVPGTLLGDISEMAERHASSAQAGSSGDERENPDKILRWVRRHARDHASDRPISGAGTRLASGGTDVG